MRSILCMLLFFGLSLHALPAISQLDAFEEDDVPDSAKLVVVNDEVPQDRTLHSETDIDWIRFVVRAGSIYYIELAQVASGIDPRLTVYGYDPLTMDVNPIDDGVAGIGERFGFTAASDGVYYASVDLGAPRTSIENIAYKLITYDNQHDNSDVNSNASADASADDYADSYADSYADDDHDSSDGNCNGNRACGEEGPDPIIDIALPDLLLRSEVDYSRSIRGSAVRFQYFVRISDSVAYANDVRLTLFLESGMTVIGELPSDCTINNLVITCMLGVIGDTDEREIEVYLSSASLGRTQVQSVVTSSDGEDRYNNSFNTAKLNIIDRPTYGINIRGDKDEYRTGDPLSLYITMEVAEEDLDRGPVGLYIKVKPPGGEDVYITDLNLNISSQPMEFLSIENWRPFSLDDENLLYLPELPAGLPTGSYTWTLILGVPNSDVRDEQNWISSAEFIHTFQP